LNIQLNKKKNPPKKRQKSINKIIIENHYELESLNFSEINEMVDWILITGKSEKPWVINIVLISDEFITQIHEQYLKKKTATDVLSFNLSEEFEDFFEGEIYISIDRAQEQANTYKVSLTCELYRLIAHGILHLLGFDDATVEERQIMKEQEDKILKKFALL